MTTRSGRTHLEKFAAAFVLRAVELAEPHAIAAALARICLRNQHRSGIRAPPLRRCLPRS